MDNKKKILLVTSAFYPEISPRSFRATELAKEFYKLGHSVTVITKYRDEDYLEFLKQYPINLKMWGKSNFKEVPSFSKKPWSIITSILRRLLLVLFEYPGIEEMFKVKKVLKREGAYDLMLSFAVPYPVHWGVAWARKAQNTIAKKWVADCGDPYMGDVLDSFRKLFYFGFLEKKFCSKADVIAIPVESAIPAYYPEFRSKIKVIPQGFNFDLEELKPRVLSNPIPKFAYAGGFLKGIRDPKQLLEYLAHSARQFEFYVFTNKPDELEQYKNILNEKLHVSNFVPRDELMTKLAEMDFLINFDNNTQRNIPSKLIDYAITGRPVLNITNQFEKDKVEAFLQGNYTDKLNLPNPKNHHISVITQKFLSVLEA